MIDYVVQSGESLYAIAQRVGVPFPMIAQVNGITDASYIYVGQVLKIPVADNTHAAPPLHFTPMYAAPQVEMQSAYAYAAPSYVPVRYGSVPYTAGQYGSYANEPTSSYVYAQPQYGGVPQVYGYGSLSSQHVGWNPQFAPHVAPHAVHEAHYPDHMPVHHEQCLVHSMVETAHHHECYTQYNESPLAVTTDDIMVSPSLRLIEPVREHEAEPRVEADVDTEADAEIEAELRAEIEVQPETYYIVQSEWVAAPSSDNEYVARSECDIEPTGEAEHTGHSPLTSSYLISAATYSQLDTSTFDLEQEVRKLNERGYLPHI
ncbi:LysM peptidoglycan-binding domain-containing protein [Paenibacillus sp. 481]|uniref:LysM peptidoglycan-binding domain-containing protein n=1 Tax=Paenibacillus sp. 481 TaxID=2835869 RepID=UPI001E3F0ACF|nr:LysM domain-containing protein [Paenibacillus sp. 481]UHA72088.1 LysM peptidoglycan-binding domain-containing protein [Paenibacillus sp. 481]